MNFTSSTLLPLALMTTFSSSAIQCNAMPNYSFSLYSSLTETQRTIYLKRPSAWEQASSLFPELRELSLEERNSYNVSLAKLFKKTGRKFQ